MYLNKSAERTEKILSVPHIIEMSCRITQRRQTGMHSSNQQRCHWNVFFFFFAFTAKSRWNNSWAKDQRGGREAAEKVCMDHIICMMHDALKVMLCFLLDSQIISWSASESFFGFGFVPAWCPVLLPLLRDLPSCLRGHLLVQSSLEKAKLSHQTGLIHY